MNNLFRPVRLFHPYRGLVFIIFVLPEKPHHYVSLLFQECSYYPMSKQVLMNLHLALLNTPFSCQEWTM